MTNRFSSSIGFAAFAAMFMIQPLAFGAGVTVLTVPWIPTTPTSPHSTYAVNATTESTIVLGATVPSAVGSADSFTYQWTFGDGTKSAVIALTNPYDISITHQYPASAAVGTTWTATVAVTDTTSKATGSANYYVFQEANSASTAALRLQSRVNIAIDWGLWYMHQTEWRGTTTVNAKTVNWGGWDSQSGAASCPTVNSQAYDCGPYGVTDAENVQAFEVNGHLQNGSATDPYTDDVARGMARMFSFLVTQAAGTTTYQYNPETANYTCKDGSVPTTTDALCASHGGQFFYNSTATACATPPCTFTFDGNKNGLQTYSSDGSGEVIYTTAPFIDAIVAAGTPTAKAPTGPVGVQGETFQTIVQDIADYYEYGQYGYDYDVTQGYTRGYGGSDQGGGWLYNAQEGDDNSTSQWAAIGLISASRGLSISIPKIVLDANNVWITNSEDVTDPMPTGPDSFASNDNAGAFGYRGSFAYSNAWGPFAVSPSGMVQMALDGVGRTTNTKFGDSTTAFDQRWNNAETFYADNFCNSVSPYNQAYYAPRGYMYGMFSFTKSMLLHSQNGSLAPIQYLRTLTPNVFTGNSSVPKDTIDWYAALSAANGGTDPCDGVAQTLVSYQANPAYGSMDGHWFGNTYDVGASVQSAFETAWALIMLQKTVFVSCVKNLGGRGTPAGAAPARIDLTWSAQGQANSYDVLRGTTTGGPYTQIGTTTTTAYSDRTGLSDGDTYFYVLQPVNASGAEICQSNQATITVPK